MLFKLVTIGTSIVGDLSTPESIKVTLNVPSMLANAEVNIKAPGLKAAAELGLGYAGLLGNETLENMRAK